MLNLTENKEDIIETTLKDYEYIMAKFDDAVINEDYNAIESIAHSIKTILKTLGLDSLAEIAKDIEINNNDFKNINKKIKFLKTQWKIAKKEIYSYTANKNKTNF